MRKRRKVACEAIATRIIRLGEDIHGHASRSQFGGSTCVDIAGHTPGSGGVVQRRFARETPETNLYRGIFPTFAQAQASAPHTRPVGYDNAGAADLYRERTRRVYPSDYPAMFWLDRLFQEGATSVFDIGGHIGIGYYAYQRYRNIRRRSAGACSTSPP